MNRGAAGQVALRVVRGNVGIFAIYALTILLFLYGAVAIPGFASLRSILALLTLASFTGIVSAGQGLTVLLGGVDLSVPYVISMGDILVPYFHHVHVPLSVSILIIAAIALIIGAFNGFFSAYLRLHPLIITLAVGFIVKGGLLVFTQGVPPGTTPAVLTNIASMNGTIFGFHFPPVIVVWAVVAIVVIWGSRNTRLGRQIYALGANAVAAELVLVNRVRVWTYTFMASALLAAITGILLAGFSGSGQINIGSVYLFTSIGAVTIGGTSILGGVGSYVGTIAGVLALTEASSVLVGLNISASLQESFYGLVILVMITIYGRQAHVRNRL